MQAVEILLVEDNPADVELTQERMEDAKILNRMNVVTDGEHAMDYLFNRGEYKGAERPDLILLDLNLPKKSGLEVLREIKEDQNLRSIPVVILTSSEAEEDIVESYDLHANSYVRKPVDLHGYKRIVNAIDDFWLGLVKYPREERR